MIFLQVTDSVSSPVDTSRLEEAAKQTLEYIGASQESILTVVITDDVQMQKLNQEFLHVDATTDVLSFPGDFIDPETNNPYLGDVLISYEQALAQAKDRGHWVGAELELLIVHGVLHLLGYDDLEAIDRKRMWEVQADILEKLGSPLSPPE